MVLAYIGKKRVPVVTPTTRSLLGDIDGEWSMVRLLLVEARKGNCSYLVPYTLLFFGCGLPLLKLLAVAYWAAVPGASRAALHLAARMSRWTAVDAVAEAMIVALLLRGGVSARHREGYVTFVGYCALSAASIWILDDAAGARRPGLVPRALLRLCGGRAPPRWLLAASLAFFAATLLLGAGLFPLARLWVPEKAIRNSPELRSMLEGYWLTDDMVSRILSEIAHCIPKPGGEASVFGAVCALLGSGHIYTIVGSALLFTGVLVLPVAEAALACAVSWRASACLDEDEDKYDEGLGGKPSASEQASGLGYLHRDWLCRALEAVADLALLDVFVVGMLVAVLVLSQLGHFLSAMLLDGFYFLLPAAGVGIVHQILCEVATVQLEAHGSDALLSEVSESSGEEEPGGPQYCEMEELSTEGQ